MPDLPALTVTAAQATRILDTFTGQTDDQGQTLTPASAYRRWLKERLREKVLAAEARALDEAHNVSKRQALDTLAGSLD
jgi:hypothetical protein